MAFNSPAYLAFFIVVLLASWACVGLPRVRIWLLLLASYHFYTANNGWLIVLILVSTQIDFVAARRIEDSSSEKTRRRLLLLSVCTNLGILGVFKYFNFFAFSIFEIFQTLGWHLSWVDLNIILPVGISFYTFQSMSYTIDVYRGAISAERSWVRFAFFVAFFPQLVAGPIVRPSDFLPQLDRKPELTYASLEAGLSSIFLGLVKKIVFADTLGRYADLVFDAPGGASMWMALLGSYAFTFQIYFDFSGYTDIAIGCSRLIGYELPPNFRRPYAAANITDFWRRWHISLSAWLRDYLYIPLGGNRGGTIASTYRNLMLTMLLGGLWHGAAWHFVLWGGIQGACLVLERAAGIGRPRARPPGLVGNLLRILVTFHVVVFSWIIFRAESNEGLVGMLAALFRSGPIPVLTPGVLLVIAVVIGGVATQVLGERIDFRQRFTALPLAVKAAAYAGVATAVTVFGSMDATPFIYFQF